MTVAWNDDIANQIHEAMQHLEIECWSHQYFLNLYLGFYLGWSLILLTKLIQTTK